MHVEAAWPFEFTVPCFADVHTDMLVLLSVSYVVPPNGLVVYCGTIMTDEGKEKKVGFCFHLPILVPAFPRNLDRFIDLFSGAFPHSYNTTGLTVIVLRLLTYIPPPPPPRRSILTLSPSSPSTHHCTCATTSSILRR